MPRSVAVSNELDSFLTILHERTKISRAKLVETAINEVYGSALPKSIKVKMLMRDSKEIEKEIKDLHKLKNVMVAFGRYSLLQEVKAKSGRKIKTRKLSLAKKRELCLNIAERRGKDMKKKVEYEIQTEERIFKIRRKLSNDLAKKINEMADLMEGGDSVEKT